MPLTDRALSQTGIVADHEKRLRRMRFAKGFDPNEDPVIIGAGATAGGGSTPDAVGGGEPGGIAIGVGANVDSFSSGVGTNGIAIGNNAGVGGGSHTGGDGNIAVGYSSQSGGFADADSRNTAVGWEATAQAGSAVAVGARATAEDQYAIAIGSFASASAVGAVAVGYLAGAGDTANVAVGREASANFGVNHVCVGYSAVVDGTSADPGGHSVEDTALGYGTHVASSYSVAVGSSAEAGHPAHTSQMATAVGYNTRASYTHSTALGANAATDQDHQIMLGTDADFVEIPGDSSTAPNGLVLTDTATGTRYIVQITSGALVLSAAP